VKNTCGWASVPLTNDITIRSVASFPVGAPFAMSTDGAGARSLRAPAKLSIVGRPCAGSKTPGWVTGPATGTGFLHDPPTHPRNRQARRRNGAQPRVDRPDRGACIPIDSAARQAPEELGST